MILCLNEKHNDTFIKELQEKNPTIIPLSPYIHSKEKILCRCKICGNEWEATPNDLLDGHSCKKCTSKRTGKALRTDPSDFIQRVRTKNPNIEIIGTYTTSKDPIRCRCKLCGNEWSPIAGGLLKKKGCPNCNHTSTSFVEQIILHSFKYVLPNSEVISRDKKAIGMELDVYIPGIKTAIEYGAYYWHKDKLKSDLLKLELCESSGIRLIIIYDKCDDRFENDNFITYKEDLYENEFLIRDLIDRLFNLTGLDKSLLTDKAFSQVEGRAYQASRKATTKEFSERLKTINPSIKVLGDYNGSHKPIKVQCQKCGRIWESTPHALLTGYNCRNCYLHNRFLKQEAFVSKVEAHNPNILVLGTYTGTANHIKCKCKVCGHIWEPLAKNIIKYGCPKCANTAKTGKTQMTQLEFEKSANALNPDIQVISEYIGSHKPIKCRCKKCGYEWEITAFSLYSRICKCKKCSQKE